MNDADVLDGIEAMKQVPYPVFGVDRDPNSFWDHQFKGWEFNENDPFLYHTFREAAIAMLKSDV